MHSKTRIAALVAALVFGAQAGIAAMEDAKSVESTQAVEQKTDTLAAAPAAAPEAAAAPADKAQEKSATDTMRGWYDRFVAALGKGRIEPPSVFPEGADGDVHTWLMPTQIAYFEQLEQQRLANLQPQAPVEIQPAATQVQAQHGTTNLVSAHDAAAGAMR